MSKITVDMSGVQLSFAPLPFGSYTGIVSEAKLTKSKADKPMLAVTIKMTWPGFEGQNQFLYCSLVKEALFSLAYLLIAENMYDEEEFKRGELSFDTEDLLGKEIGLLITPDRKTPGNVSMRAIPAEDCTGPSVDENGEITSSAAVEKAAPSGGVASLF